MVRKHLEADSKQAVLVLADVKAAVDTCERGDANVFETLEQIVAIIDAYRLNRPAA